MIFERKKYLEELVGARINLIKNSFYTTYRSLEFGINFIFFIFV